jgi:hypothetical protein
MCPIHFQSHLFFWNSVVVYSKSELNDMDDKDISLFYTFLLTNSSNRLIPICGLWVLY